MIKKLFTLFFSLTVIFFVFGKTVHASEGTIELRSTTDEDYRCFVVSVQMQDFKYRVLVSCRNIVYPADDTVFNYILWATGKNDGKLIKFGSLGLGRASFSTGTAFSNMFVTIEKSAKPKEPSNRVVMRGVVEPIGFLQTETSPTPTPEGGEKVEETTDTEQEATVTSTRQRLITGLKRAGLVSLVALVAIVGLVFVIARSRG